MVDEIETNVATSHKGKRILGYSLNCKLKATVYAENNSNSSAGKKSDVDKKQYQNGTKRKRLDGAGRKPLDQQIEEVLVEWIYNRRKKDCEFLKNL